MTGDSSQRENKENKENKVREGRERKKGEAARDRRFGLNRTLRRCLIVLAVVMIAAGGALAGWALTVPGYRDETVALYRYNQEAKVNYRVYVKPNELYPESVLDPGKIYVAPYVNYVNTFFTYRFSGEKPAAIKGEYDVTGLMEAFSGRDKDRHCVWQKSFTYVPSTPFSGDDRELALQQVVTIPFAEYYDFVKRISKETELYPDDVRLTVKWNVNLEAVTPHGTVKEQMTQAMVIPVGQKAFEIGGDLGKNKPGALTATRRVETGVDRQKIYAAGAAAAAGFLFLFFLLLFTAPRKPLPLAADRLIAEAFKKYGERIATIKAEPVAAGSSCITVAALEDLIRIADELGRPVLYRPPLPGREKEPAGEPAVITPPGPAASCEHSFYVLNGSELYFYCLPVISPAAGKGEEADYHPVVEVAVAEKGLTVTD